MSPDDTGAVPEREVDDEETGEQCPRCLRAVADCVCCEDCDGTGEVQFTGSAAPFGENERPCKACKGTGRKQP